MIRLQIVERPGAELYKLLKRAIRSKDLRTFSLEKHGTRVVHIRSPGYMKWTATDGLIACEIDSPKEPGKEWQLLSAVIGRFAAFVDAINIQLDAPPPEKKKKRRKGKKKRRR